MRIRHPAATSGTPIGVREAAKKYGIASQTISQWASRGEVTVLAEAAARGDRTELDELSLQKRIRLYTPHRDAKSRRLRAQPPSHPSPPRPLPPVPLVSRKANVGSPLGMELVPRPTGGSALIAARSLAPLVSTQAMVEGFLAACETRRLHKPTIDTYRWALLPFARAFPQLTYGRRQIVDYVLGHRIGPESLALMLRRIRTFYGWLSREHDLPIPNLTRVDLPRKTTKPRWWTQEDMARILAFTRSHLEYTVVVALAQTGVRREELTTITSRTLHDNWAEVKGKMGERVAYIPSEAFVTLTMELGMHGVLWSERSPLSVKILEELMRNLLRRAGLWSPYVGCHSFRHSYGGEYIKNGGAERLLPFILGHGSGSMTGHYTHVPSADVMAEAMKYAPRRFLQIALGAAPQAVA